MAKIPNCVGLVQESQGKLLLEKPVLRLKLKSETKDKGDLSVLNLNTPKTNKKNTTKNQTDRNQTQFRHHSIGI